MTVAEKFDALAALLVYPGADYAARVDHCREALRGDAESLQLLENSAATVTPLPLEARQELFIQTFDLSPVCTLEVGWHLYGENYDRGAFLVRMRQQMREHGVAESDELPDHLTHVLQVLGRMEPGAQCEFAERFVLPALAKMMAGFKSKGNPFEHVMNVIGRSVHALCPNVPLTVAEPTLPILEIME
jgi:nitrate reductase molybdenum cofactor assembly chaperone NarJ/NarW